MSKAVDNAVGKLRADWLCRDNKIFRRRYQHVVCGYYYDNPPLGYCIGRFKAALFQKWIPYAFELGETLPKPRHRVPKPISPKNLALVIQERILEESELGFVEPSLDEYLMVLDSAYAPERRHFGVWQGRAYALILVGRYDEAKADLHEGVEKFWHRLDADEQSETKGVTSFLERDPSRAKDFLLRKISENKRMLGLS